ncbi:indolepyruvate ferredoxin oxidoreductase subunit beta [Methanomicrobiaceae archaeon CYW5]|uniref:indolepyruvate ferredoxin oxidoreductase subunit beta n=1 Tax=Methanovulcanius yangii TaxID=1789227 RepID=UPI0029C9FA54|nr:indolepyruvate ferredoxin oxidoreductase subunit beta [Methanovulcanius yangii]MBT8508054.1 indolepyruvate ferredoxin oxidoreductase subunit beta [Methanovulcanius yangii]
MSGSYDVLIVGVGGQGTILASNILGEACLLEGKSVRGAETHGMAQRGGSVETHIRIDGKYGPLISPGTADLIISFDLLEALRYSHFLKDGGTIISNTETIIPTSAFQYDAEVPEAEDISRQLAGRDVLTVDAAALALEAGTILAQNVVMLGAASRHIPLTVESLKEAVRRCVPPKTVDTNLKAFDLGRAALE